jgi:hypothetical protein
MIPMLDHLIQKAGTEGVQKWSSAWRIAAG